MTQSSLCATACAGRSFRGALVVAAWTLAGAFGFAHAQANPTHDVLSGRDLSADRVLEALEPSAVRTRSIRIGKDGKAVAAPQRASASLLITFETDSAELGSAARRQLDIVAAALKNDRLSSYRFMVEGHADPRGAADSNLALSRERADSVRRYLIESHGIEADRLTAEGKGDREPLNTSSPAAPENRRVTFVTLGNR
jgi:outer membrane protein OmpA-like peptidoglycan-associated protein